jgi:hypothetical protein
MKENIFDRLVSVGDETSAATDEILEPFAPNPNHNGELRHEEQIPRTAADVKRVTQELLKHGHIEEAIRPFDFRHAIEHEQEINTVLEPLDLLMRLDTHRGVAFLMVAPVAGKEPTDGEEWTHPLVKRQRLTLEQSLLVAILRQTFAMHEQESGVGQGAAKIAVDDLLPRFLTYFKDSGSDAKNESRLLNLLDQLKTYGIVTEVDSKQEVTIRPLIAYLANPESLAALLDVLTLQSQSEVEQEQSP